MSDKQRMTLKPSVIWDDHGHGGVIMDMQRGCMSMLNVTGLQVVQACQEGETLDAIAHTLSQKYGLAIETALSDVKEFAASLAERGYIEFTKE